MVALARVYPLPASRCALAPAGSGTGTGTGATWEETAGRKGGGGGEEEEEEEEAGEGGREGGEEEDARARPRLSSSREESGWGPWRQPLTCQPSSRFGFHRDPRFLFVVCFFLFSFGFVSFSFSFYFLLLYYAAIYFSQYTSGASCDL
jgi:hypothetical protein